AGRRAHHHIEVVPATRQALDLQFPDRAGDDLAPSLEPVRFREILDRGAEFRGAAQQWRTRRIFVAAHGAIPRSAGRRSWVAAPGTLVGSEAWHDAAPAVRLPRSRLTAMSALVARARGAHGADSRHCRRDGAAFVWLGQRVEQWVDRGHS